MSRRPGIGAGRSREGAWIEMIRRRQAPKGVVVAPARERGLKLMSPIVAITNNRRSREGAWIEIINDGVRINSIQVAPARERGLKCKTLTKTITTAIVAPARERGLKFYDSDIRLGIEPCRSREGAWIEISTTMVSPTKRKSLPRGSVD